MRLSYANITATVALVFCAAGTALAATSGATNTISQVCADRNGNLSLPTSSGSCRRHGHLKTLSAPGATGSPTQLTSPDGKFTVSATDAGITLAGPQASLKLTESDLAITAALSTTLTSGTTLALTSGTATALTAGTALSVTAADGAQVDAGSNFDVTAGSTVDVEANGTAAFAGRSKVSLGGPNCTKAVSRVGDAVGNTTITSGSSAVFAC